MIVSGCRYLALQHAHAIGIAVSCHLTSPFHVGTRGEQQQQLQLQQQHDALHIIEVVGAH